MQTPAPGQFAEARPAATIGAVVIGRNEGARLVACLAALSGRVSALVYVDSGSTDGSLAAAAAAGAVALPLDLGRPFTAARARNAGLAALGGPGGPDYVQFVDGDCTLRDGWLATATAFLDAHPEVGAVCGRRRERFPEASVYNRLCDLEWDTPVGPVRACGGDALMRMTALRAAGGFRAELIAGEEPELCLRMRRLGWTVWRLDAEMTWHDAAILRFGQWWRRSRRAGHAFAEGAWLHGAAPERHWVAETRRALLWGAGLPLAAALLAFAFPLAALFVLALYPLQFLRLTLRAAGRPAQRLGQAFFTLLGKIPEALGVLGFAAGLVSGRRARLIEYKQD